MQPVVLPLPTGPAIKRPNAALRMKSATVGGAVNVMSRIEILDVPGDLAEPLGVVSVVAEAYVAGLTEDPSDYSAVMVMIDAPPFFSRVLGAARCASPFLFGQEIVSFAGSDPVASEKVSALVAALLTHSALPSITLGVTVFSKVRS